MESAVPARAARSPRSLPFATQEIPSGIIIEPVRTLAEFYAAMSHLHTEYVRLGLLERQPGEMLFSPCFFPHSSLLLVAKKGHNVVGSISLIPQAELGIPAETVFSDEIWQQGCNPLRTAEIGSLCIDERYRGSGLLRGLYATAILYAAFWQQIETVFIQVDSRKAGFYRNMLQFKPVGNSRPHPAFQNQAVTLLRMDIKPALAQLRCSLYPQRRLSLKQVMNTLQIDSLYQRLHHSLQQGKRFQWNAEYVRQYCQRCGIDSTRLDKRLPRVLQPSDAQHNGDGHLAWRSAKSLPGCKTPQRNG